MTRATRPSAPAHPGLNVPTSQREAPVVSPQPALSPASSSGPPGSSEAGPPFSGPDPLPAWAAAAAFPVQTHAIMHGPPSGLRAPQLPSPARTPPADGFFARIPSSGSLEPSPHPMQPALNGPGARLPDLPPVELALPLVEAYFDAQDPNRPLLHRGLFARRPINPLLLTTMLLYTARACPAAIPGLPPERLERLQAGLFQRARVELMQALQAAPLALDLPGILSIIVAILLFGSWADARGLYATALVLQRLAGKLVTSVLFVKHRAMATLSWENILCSLLGISRPEDAPALYLNRDQIAALRDTWIDYWQVQNAMWYLIREMHTTRARSRDDWDAESRSTFDTIVDHLYGLPFEKIWAGSFQEDFDPRHSSHVGKRVAPLLAWVDMPPGAERQAIVELLPEAIKTTRGLIALLHGKIRLLTDSFLAACRRRGIRTPSELTVLASDPNADAGIRELFITRNYIDAGVATIWYATDSKFKDGWYAMDAEAAARPLAEYFESWACGLDCVAQGPALLAIRIEVRTGIGIFLSGAEVNLDKVDVTDEFESGGPFAALVPTILSATGVLSSLVPLLPPACILNLVPALLSISLFHASCYRRLRASFPLPPESQQAFKVVCDNLAICLDLLQTFCSLHPGSFVESVFHLIQKLLDQGRVEMSDLAAAAGKVDAEGGIPGTETQAKVLTDLLSGL